MLHYQGKTFLGLFPKNHRASWCQQAPFLNPCEDGTLFLSMGPSFGFAFMQSGWWPAQVPLGLWPRPSLPVFNPCTLPLALCAFPLILSSSVGCRYSFLQGSFLVPFQRGQSTCCKFRNRISLYIAQTHLKRTAIHLPQSPKCWDRKHVSPCPGRILQFL